MKHEAPGYVFSYRSIWQHDFFKGNGMRVAIWHWLLHHAAWEETPHDINGTEVRLERGEVCFSQAQIERDTGATRKQIRTVLEWLISTKNASKIGANERANGGASVRANERSLLLIEKYEKYQDPKGIRANEVASQGADKGPIKEKDKNIPVGKAAPSGKKVVEIEGVKATAWRVGKAYLSKHGISDPGPLIGKFMKDAGGKASKVLEAIEAAQTMETEDPVPYITKFLSQQAPHHRQAQQWPNGKKPHWVAMQERNQVRVTQ